MYVIHAVLVSSLCNGELPTITATPLIENVSNKTNEKTNEKNENLESTNLQTKDLTETTGKLREILSSSQKRGQWGERIVEDILNVIGLIEGINYTKQGVVESGERPEGYEPNPDLLSRVFESLSKISESSKSSDSILVVSHAGIVHALENFYNQPSQRVPNLGGRWFQFDVGNELIIGKRVALIDKKDKQIFAFEDIKDIVIQEYRRRSRDEILSNLLEDLTLKAEIKINKNLD